MVPIVYFKTPTISYVSAINFQRNPFLKQVMQIEATQVSATPCYIVQFYFKAPCV